MEQKIINLNTDTFFDLNKIERSKIINYYKLHIKKFNFNFYGKENFAQAGFYSLLEDYVEGLKEVKTKEDLKKHYEKYKEASSDLQKSIFKDGNEKTQDVPYLDSMPDRFSVFCSYITQTIEKNSYSFLEETKIRKIDQWITNKTNALNNKINSEIYNTINRIPKYKSEEEFIEALNKFKEKYGFKNILIEETESLNNKAVWLYKMDKALSSIASVLDVPTQLMSLNGEIYLANSRSYCSMVGAGGVAFGDNGIVMINGEQDFMISTWLHELAHIIDFKAGEKYLHDSNNDRLAKSHLSEIISLEGSGMSYVDNPSIFASQHYTDEISAHKLLRDKFGAILGYKDFDKHQEESVWERLPKMYDNLSNIVLSGLLQDTRVDYATLTRKERDTLKGNSLHDLVKKMLFSMVESPSESLNKFKIDLVEYFKNNICDRSDNAFIRVGYHIVDREQHKLKISDEEINDIVDRFIDNGGKIKKGFFNTMNHYGFVAANSYQGKFGYFSKSSYVLNSFEDAKYYSHYNSLYFAKPTELFARYMESLVSNKSRSFYITHTEEEKTSVKGFFKELIQYCGYDISQKNENSPLLFPQSPIDKIKNLREKFLTSTKSLSNKNSV